MSNYIVEPLSAVCIVKDPKKCPKFFTCLTQTKDGQDANLWKKGLFGKKDTRYLCYSVDPNQSNNEILTEVVICDSQSVSNRDHTVDALTRDSKEPLFKDKNIRLGYKTFPIFQASQGFIEVGIFNEKERLEIDWEELPPINKLKIAFKNASQKEIMGHLEKKRASQSCPHSMQKMVSSQHQSSKK